MRRGSLIVACSIAEVSQGVSIHSSGELILASHRETSVVGDTVTLPPDSVAVIRIKGDH